MMNFTPLAYDAPLSADTLLQPAEAEVRVNRHADQRPPLSAEFLRHCAWEIGEQRAWQAYGPTENHVGLGLVAPYQGFAHWRIRHDWIEETRKSRGDSSWIDPVAVEYVERPLLAQRPHQAAPLPQSSFRGVRGRAPSRHAADMWLRQSDAAAQRHAVRACAQGAQPATAAPE